MFSAVCLTVTAHAASAGDPASLTPSPSIGDHFSNVFSIGSSLRVPGFDELVGRNGGSGDYTFTGRSKDHDLTFKAAFRYDGSPPSEGENTFQHDGMTQCWQGTCQVSTDASGLIYSKLIWGVPPARLNAGMTWRVAINRPWELGAAGVQTVTVVHVDQADDSVTLRREGDSTGAFDGERPTVKLVRSGQPVTFAVTPGQAHWRGITTFRHGVVISDELLVDRTDQLTSKETGIVQASRRRYILLNAAPYPTIASARG